MGSQRVGHDWVTELNYLSDIVPWIYFLLPLYKYKEFDFRSYLNGQVVFSTFFNLSLNLAIRNSWLKSEFGNKEFMVWATVSLWSCFCWLFRASPSLTAKNIISLISVLTNWWCSCVESCLCCWMRVSAMTSAFSWQNSISLCPASFSIPRPNLLVLQVFLDFLLLHSSCL